MLKEIAMDIAKTVQESVQAGIKVVTEKLEPRLKDLEDRIEKLPVPEKGEKGDSVTLDDVRPIIEAVFVRAAQGLKVPDVDYEKVKVFISDQISQLPLPEKGDDGKSVTLEDVLPVIDKAVERVASSLPVPEVDYEKVKSFVDDAVAQIPVPKDGASITIEDVQPILEAAAQKAAQSLKSPEVDYESIKTFITDQVAQIPPAQDGKSVTIDEVEPLLKTMVDAIELPIPEKGDPGDSVTLEDVRPMVEEAVKSAVAEIPKPKDGEPGKDAPPVDMGAVQKMIDDAVQKAVAQIHIPEPKVPQDGKDALDIEILPEIDPEKAYSRNTYAIHKGGLWRSHERTKGMRGWETILDGIADLQIEYDGERGVKILAEKSSGEVVEKAIVMPIVIDRGIYKEGQQYAKNDGLTYAGSYWIAQKDLPEGRPGDGNADFRLAVKRGRDANTKVKVGA